MKCLHCNIREAKKFKKGLCSKCYWSRGVREMYPHLPNPRDREPSAEEVERMVAEGYANLPDWWQKETDRMMRGED